MSDEQTAEIPLTLAAQQLRLSWERAWRLILRGGLEGRKVDGKWKVTVASVEQFERERRSEEAEATDAA